jgi:hypothetical protein
MWGIVHSLQRNERELVFDYCLGLLDDAARAKEAQELLKTSSGAAFFHQKLHECLKPLGHYSIEKCPCQLCEITIHRLVATARPSGNAQPESTWPKGEIAIMLCTSLLQSSFL